MNQNEQFKAPSILYSIVCRDAAGNLKWSEELENLVTTVGKTDIIDKYLKGSDKYTNVLLLAHTSTVAMECLVQSP